MSNSAAVNRARIYPPQLCSGIVRGRIVCDWTDSYRKVLRTMQIVPGPVAAQKRSQISDAVLRSDFSTVCRVLDVSKGHCVSCLVELKGGGKLTKSTWRICSLCDLLYCYKCVENFPLRFSPNQVCKADVCKSCFRFMLRTQILLDPWFNAKASVREIFHLHAEATNELVQLSGRLSNYEGLVRFFVQHKEHVMLQPLRELEEGIKLGLGTLGKLLKKVPPNEPLARYLTNQLTDSKTKLSQSKALFDQAHPK